MEFGEDWTNCRNNVPRLRIKNNIKLGCGSVSTKPQKCQSSSFDHRKSIEYFRKLTKQILGDFIRAFFERKNVSC